jgi:hypothetical protein
VTPVELKRVCMFHIGRSGSTVLADMLKQHPRVAWDGEVFEPTARKWQPGVSPSDLLRKRAETVGRKIYGIELKFFHCRLIGLSLLETVCLLEKLGFGRYIILRRRNYLRKIVSSLIAQKTKVWHLSNGKRPRLVPITINVDKLRVEAPEPERTLLQCLETYESEFAELDRLLGSQAPLRLTYESDIEKDPAVGYGKVCDYLGLEAKSAPVRLTRTTPYPLRDVIMNFQEVEARLAGTPFAWMVNE